MQKCHALNYKLKKYFVFAKCQKHKKFGLEPTVESLFWFYFFAAPRKYDF